MAVKLNKNWLLLTAAIAIGGLAFYLSNSAINNRMRLLEEESNKGKVFTSVVVASQNLQTGDTINSTTVSLRKIPQEYVNSSTITADTFESVDGLNLLIPVKAGEPILSSYTATKGGAYFSGILKTGRRALTIEVDEISSISGMLRAGDNIDILITTKPAKTSGSASNQNNQEDITFPLYSNVNVLATGQTTRGSGNTQTTYNNITLDVTPEEASNIIVAKGSGKLTAVLRNPEDKLPNATPIKNITNVIPSQQAGSTNLIEYLVGGNGGSGVGTSIQASSLSPITDLNNSINKINTNMSATPSITNQNSKPNTK